MYKVFALMLLPLVMVQDEPSLKWLPNLELEWLDFQGKPRRGTATVALTASGLSFSFSAEYFNNQLSDYSYDLEVQFYPKKSWYIKEYVNDNTLFHERLHFDITELHARKLRKRIHQTKFTNAINTEMKLLYTAINKELSAMQNLYDIETEHSQNIEAQRAWERKIFLELQRLRYYRSE
ncbi:MAG: DUF922 domain-containing protein [Flavobacteriaceae bacterium]|nr:DUF922 domain-containing protein [Flavobacteriaceae bacterium]